jgi:hypothetical protein
VAELPHCATCRMGVRAGENIVFRPDGRVQHLACPEVVCPVCARVVKPHDPIRRDGEALLHGNCWVRRHRATKPPVKVGVPEPDGIGAAVRRKLIAGELPQMAARKVWSGPGKELPCSGCDQVITRPEVEHQVYLDDGASSLRFHRTCLDIWRRELTGYGRQMAGGSAASP